MIKHHLWRGAVLGGAVVLAACYHQVVDTGVAPGTRTIEKPWTATWLWGLVPATPIDVRRECTTGVAFVDTQMTFMNGLVAAVTLGIYSSRTVKVTCASGSASMGSPHIDVAATNLAGLAAALERAERLSAQTGSGVYVVFPVATSDATTFDGGPDR